MKKKVLVVEPEKELQSKLIDALRDRGYQALGAENFEEADDALHFLKPDVVIMELILPDRNGVDLVVNIKQNQPGAKIIVFTDIKGSTIEKSVKKKGADLFINKSNDIEENVSKIIEAVDNLLKPKPVEEKGTEGFKGNLEGVDLRDLVQAFSLMGRDIIIKIRDVKTFKEGTLYFMAGAVVDAKTGSKRGVEAFKEIMRWENGIFEVAYPKPDEPIETTIDVPLDVLLLDVVREQDEMLQEAAARPKFTPKEVLKHIRAEIPGFIGAMVFDYEEGAPLETETILEGKTFHASATLYGGILKSAMEAMEVVTQGNEKARDFIDMIITDKYDHVIMVPLHVDSYAVFLLVGVDTNPHEALNVVKRYIPLLVELYKEQELSM